MRPNDREVDHGEEGEVEDEEDQEEGEESAGEKEEARGCAQGLGQEGGRPQGKVEDQG
jgi:hypothetical protein